MNDRYMVQLDGLRTIAVSLVMFGHFTMIMPGMIMFDKAIAYAGVDLFFVLSGFLITSILLRNKDKPDLKFGHVIRQFYIRRFLRIFPLSYFVIALGLIFAIPDARRDWIWLVTYTTNWLTAMNDGRSAYFTHLWSLAVEEQFYIVFPALLLFTPKKHVKSLFVGLILLGVASRFFIRVLIVVVPKLAPHLDWLTYSSTACCFDSFGLGALLAYLMAYHHETLKALLRKYPLIFCLPAIIALVLFFCPDGKFVANFRQMFFRLFVSVTCFWVIGRAAFSNFNGFFGKFLENKAISYLGRISYGLYVYHLLVLYLFSGFAFSTSQRLSDVIFGIVVYSASAVIAASISFYLFERPINSLKKHFEYN